VLLSPAAATLKILRSATQSPYPGPGLPLIAVNEVFLEFPERREAGRRQARPLSYDSMLQDRSKHRGSECGEAVGKNEEEIFGRDVQVPEEDYWPPINADKRRSDVRVRQSSTTNDNRVLLEA